MAASVAGTSHAQAGLPCADVCAVRTLRTRGAGSILVAVAADGAGSAPRAPDGAHLACEAILEEAERWAKSTGARVGSHASARGRRRREREESGLSSFTREDAVRWAGAAKRRIAGAARSVGAGISEFSCTLLVALVDETRGVFFQIGDGAIVYRTAGGEYVPALWPQSGEYANSTWFVTDDDLADRIQSAVVEAVHEVALLTDGLQRLALRLVGREAHGPFFEPMFARLRCEPGAARARLLRELRAFLASPAVNQRTDDDKTLVLATRLSPTSGRVRARSGS